MKNPFDNETDEYLMLVFKDGNDAAFEELVKRYKDKIFNYINRYIHNPERGEEITQEVFIRVYRSRDRYEVKAKFSTFIYRIALNLAYNEVRDRNRRKTDVQDDFSTLPENLTPDKVFERNEITELIKTEIENLPKKYKDVLTLCTIEGFPYKEVSKILGISIGTVQSRLARARVQLKKRLSNFINLEG